MTIGALNGHSGSQGAKFFSGGRKIVFWQVLAGACWHGHSGRGVSRDPESRHQYGFCFSIPDRHPISGLPEIGK
jgi:hypothetical protein